MNRITINTPVGFAFDETVISHGWYLLAPFRWDRATSTLRRGEWFDGIGTVDLTIRTAANAIAVSSDAKLSSVKPELKKRMTRMFQLDIDLATFHERCMESPTHREVATRRFGRMLCGATMFEDVVKIIATTNTTWRQTMNMVENITSVFGGTSKSGARSFPTPEAIAGGSKKQLDECRLGYRAAFVKKIADDVAVGKLSLEQLTDFTLTPEQQLKQYRTLPGVGPYAAAHLMAMEGRHDFIAVDTEFRKFVRTRYHRGRDVTDATLLRRYAKWREWQYLAYWSELWLSISPALEEFEKSNLRSS